MTPPTRVTRILRQHLQTDRLLGVSSVPLGQSVTVPEASDMESPNTNNHPRTPEPTPELAPGPTPSPTPDGGNDPVALLQAMDEHEVSLCQKCPLCESRSRTVFGEGDAGADLMFIGEGPGQKEDQQGRPFVGPAGKMLDKQITAMKLSRQQVYITNIVKCRPPNNRAPLTPETDACWGYLVRQIQIIQPKVIVTLGGPATKTLLKTTRGITAIRGTWHRLEDFPDPINAIPVMPTFHPAYLLRVYTPDNRAKVWSDLQKVMEALGLPIS